MADPGFTVPYPYPNSSPIDLEYFDFMLDSNPTLANLSSVEEQEGEGEPPPSSVDLCVDDIMDPNDPFDDPMIWNKKTIDNNNGSNNVTLPQEAGPSTKNYSNTDNARSKWYDDGIGMPITVWPPPLAPYQCTCCQVLREIIHINGNCTSKLEIHGRLGMICHAILETKDQFVEGSSVSQYHMVDFCKKSIVYVKQFLGQYCEDRKRAGFVLLQDPLSIFYEALCVGIEWDENINNDRVFDPSPSTWAPQGETGGDIVTAEIVTKTSLAQQCRG